MNEQLYSIQKLDKIAAGNKDFIDQMLALFISLAPQQVDEMKKNLAKNDFENIAKVAHSLKPSLDQMDITSLHQPIRDLEVLATKQPEKDKVKQLIEKIDITVQKVCNAINKLQ